MYFFSISETYGNEKKDYFASIYCTYTKKGNTKLKDLSELREKQDKARMEQIDTELFNYMENEYIGFLPSDLKYIQLYKKGIINRIRGNIEWFSHRKYFRWIFEIKMDNTNYDPKNNKVYNDLYLGVSWYKVRYFCFWVFCRVKMLFVQIGFFFRFFIDSFSLPKNLFRTMKKNENEYYHSREYILGISSTDKKNENKTNYEDSKSKYIESIGKTTSLAVSLIALVVTLAFSIYNSLNNNKTINDLKSQLDVQSKQIELLENKSTNLQIKVEGLELINGSISNIAEILKTKIKTE